MDFLEPLPQAPALILEMPEGTMDPQSAFYIERSFDKVALGAIARQGVTITIKGPRQMGKSSLLVRTCQAARGAGKRVAFLDFQLFDNTTLSDPPTFFRQFCDWLSDELELESKTAEYWEGPLGNSQKTSRYLQRYLLKELNGPLVLAMDEVESIFDTSFRSDFFGMLRSWHNSRQINPVWKQLDLVLVTSTEPYQLIENLNQSPFNVGEVIELSDFTSEQVGELNRRHNLPFSGSEQEQLMSLLSGHPYLVRRALYLVASGRIAPKELFATSTEDRGPFGDHLRNHLFRLGEKPELGEAMREVLKRNTCSDEHLFFRLRGAGLVKREGQAVLPRCKLYETYFRLTLLERGGGQVKEPTPAPQETAMPDKATLPKELPAGLSMREVEVLRLVASGLSNAQVAEKMVLSVYTINSHLASIYSKLGLSSRTEAVRFAIDHHLL